MPAIDPLTAWAGLLSFRSARHRAARLEAFARAERGSQLDMLAAAGECPDPEQAALYLRHAHDESRHARAFASRARELGAAGWIRADGGALHRQLGEARFLAFVHLGEDRARRRFRSLIRALERLEDAKSARLLGALLPDEDRHASYTLETLSKRHGDPSPHLRAARRWELWTTWQRLAAWNTGLLFSLGAGLLYLSLAPLALFLRWTRPPAQGWTE